MSAWRPATGEIVEAYVSGAWRLATAHAVESRTFRLSDAYPARTVVIVWLRRLGKTQAGLRYPRVRVRLGRVRPPRNPPDPEPAHVYADYLEDRGYSEAAAALREAFPLPAAAGRKEEPSLWA